MGTGTVTEAKVPSRPGGRLTSRYRASNPRRRCHEQHRSGMTTTSVTQKAPRPTLCIETSTSDAVISRPGSLSCSADGMSPGSEWGWLFNQLTHSRVATEPQMPRAACRSSAPSTSAPGRSRGDPVTARVPLQAHRCQLLPTAVDHQQPLGFSERPQMHLGRAALRYGGDGARLRDHLVAR